MKKYNKLNWKDQLRTYVECMIKVVVILLMLRVNKQTIRRNPIDTKDQMQIKKKTKSVCSRLTLKDATLINVLV